MNKGFVGLSRALSAAVTLGACTRNPAQSSFGEPMPDYLFLEETAGTSWCVQQGDGPLQQSGVEAAGPDAWRLRLRSACSLVLHHRVDEGFYVSEYRCDDVQEVYEPNLLFAPERLRAWQTWDASPAGPVGLPGAFGDCPGYKAFDAHYTCVRLQFESLGSSHLPTEFSFGSHAGLMSVQLHGEDEPWLRAECLDAAQ